jgi:hypothetical protein
MLCDARRHRTSLWHRRVIRARVGELHSPQQNSTTTSYNHLNISEFDFATGVGAQLELDQRRAGGWAVRAQYDRFIGHGNTELAALGLTYSF